jgi:predicted DNA-binding transcriptional regulator YafY
MMPYHANLLKVVTDVLELPGGASFSEIKKVITDFEDKDCHKSKVERILKHLREVCKLTIKVRGYRYFLERNDNLQRFYSATVGANLAELLMVNAGEDPIIDLGSFRLGSEVTCMNEVVSALREHRVMEINYCKLADNGVAWRSIQPMFLRWYASQWYLFARNLPLVKDDSPRAFRMDCIREVKFGSKFKPKREDAPDFFAHRFIGVSGHDANAVEVVLHMDQHALRWLRSTVDFDHFGVSLKALGAPSGWWEVRWNIDPNAEFIELLSRIQADFKVVGPESFKKVYRERLEVLLKRIS